MEMLQWSKIIETLNLVLQLDKKQCTLFQSDGGVCRAYIKSPVRWILNQMCGRGRPEVEYMADWLQASGEAVYSSDVGVGASELLYACVVPSTEALAAIDGIDTSEALQVSCAAQLHSMQSRHLGSHCLATQGAMHKTGR